MSKFTVSEPRDDDTLSDVVPSNIVSRQPSQGMDGESESADEAMEEDELISEDVEAEAAAPGETQESKRAARRAQKQKRKADENELHEKCEEMDKAKLADAVKRYSYLLRQTELFKYLVDIKVRCSSIPCR
ncbi:hypothetical protein NP233_g7028 [Leucocoprinus birnbaumii]|uniref:Uncharacterized protein n=1 Tax=Leucocoprinus birnbaumii TaxID=56174 RepID=A0AAD5VR35_9AGAR|nr:hypothetical protein NP233_g7028 [Leucocoprinus birnbaumii]